MIIKSGKGKHEEVEDKTRINRMSQKIELSRHDNKNK